VSLKKIGIGMFIVMFIGMCAIPADAVVVQTVNYKLDYPGGWVETPDFYAETYDVLYIELEATGVINLQLRDVNDVVVRVWNFENGTINKSVVIQEAASLHLYMSNQDLVNDVMVTGILYLNEAATTNTSTGTNTNTNITGGDGSSFLLVLWVIYGVVSVLFVISIWIYRKRKNPSFTYLTMVDDEELLPVGWQPDYDE